MMVFSLRFTLSFPAIWKAMPKCLQNFVLSQQLGASDLAKLEKLGVSPKGDVVKNTSATVESAQA